MKTAFMIWWNFPLLYPKCSNSSLGTTKNFTNSIRMDPHLGELSDEIMKSHFSCPIIFYLLKLPQFSCISVIACLVWMFHCIRINELTLILNVIVPLKCRNLWRILNSIISDSSRIIELLNYIALAQCVTKLSKIIEESCKWEVNFTTKMLGKL